MIATCKSDRAEWAEGGREMSWWRLDLCATSSQITDAERTVNRQAVMNTALR